MFLISLKIYWCRP